MIVTNISNEINTEKARKNWLAYWKHFSKSEYSHCSEYNCCNPHSYGALIKRNDAKSHEAFIVPVCTSHSDNFSSQLEISEEVELIPLGHTL